MHILFVFSGRAFAIEIEIPSRFLDLRGELFYCIAAVVRETFECKFQPHFLMLMPISFYFCFFYFFGLFLNAKPIHLYFLTYTILILTIPILLNSYLFPLIFILWCHFGSNVHCVSRLIHSSFVQIWFERLVFFWL